MNGNGPVRFDEAWQRANEFVRDELAEVAGSVVLVRDLQGRIRVAIDDRAATLDAERAAAWAADLEARLGAFAPGRASLILGASKMIAPDEIFASLDALPAKPDHLGGHRVLDRLILGADWTRPPFAPGPVKRLTLFGLKGGVGRSTAAAVLAWRLALSRKKILVVDLDLESPGLGTTLLPEDALPDFGVADWFVEDAVGQAGEALLREMTARSPLGRDLGEVIVVPAAGRAREGYRYLPKLARAYLEVGGAADERGFAARLQRLVSSLEALWRPDLTILDSRAGLHDIAAVAVTRLQATSLIFAIDSAQTWRDVRILFETWNDHFDRARAFREHLKMVAAQVPETDSAAYLERFRESAYSLFSDLLYDEVPAGEVAGGVNFDVTDPDGPHYPLRIHWSRSFQQFDPVGRPGALTDVQIEAAFGDFVRGVAEIVFDEPLP